MVYSQGAPQQEAADTLGPVDSEPAGFWFTVSEKACWPGSYRSPSLLDCAPFPSLPRGQVGTSAVSDAEAKMTCTCITK